MSEFDKLKALLDLRPDDLRSVDAAPAEPWLTSRDGSLEPAAPRVRRRWLFRLLLGIVALDAIYLLTEALVAGPR
jgi:hypothetical protein